MIFTRDFQTFAYDINMSRHVHTHTHTHIIYTHRIIYTNTIKRYKKHRLDMIFFRDILETHLQLVTNQFYRCQLAKSPGFVFLVWPTRFPGFPQITWMFCTISPGGSSADSADLQISDDCGCFLGITYPLVN